ncbi:hypothetical protein DJ55_4174 [Yersinia pseudotuberculosis]|nr:hypothetical protein DJ55_4174 [Yersinia pseudotuberculosis]
MQSAFIFQFAKDFSDHVAINLLPVSVIGGDHRVPSRKKSAR